MNSVIDAQIDFSHCLGAILIRNVGSDKYPFLMGRRTGFPELHPEHEMEFVRDAIENPWKAWPDPSPELSKKYPFSGWFGAERHFGFINKLR